MLADYFKENAQEVTKMIKFEYNFKDELKAARQEGKAEGMEKGTKEGKKEGIDYVLNLMAQGLSNEEIKKKIKGRDFQD